MNIVRIESIDTIRDIVDIQDTVFCGDARNLLVKLPERSIDLVVTSPPYDDLRDYSNGISWDFQVFKDIAKLLYKVMKPGGVIVWVVGDKVVEGNKSLTSFKQAVFFQEIGFKVYDVMIYEKAGTDPPHKNRYFNAFEYMFIFCKGKPKTVNLLCDKPNKWAGHQTYGDITRREKDGSLVNKGKKTIKEFSVRTNIWRYINGKGFTTRDAFAHKHPAIFPEKLVEDHILSWSQENDVVLDPFGGSGTTIKVASKLKRKWIYIDKVEEYCHLAIERISKAK